MPSKRIGVICDWAPIPVRSGSNRRLVGLIQHLRASGSIVDLVVLGYLSRKRRSLLQPYVHGLYSIPAAGSGWVLPLLRRLYWRIVDKVDDTWSLDIDQLISGLRHRLKGDGLGHGENYWHKAFEGLDQCVAAVASERAWDVAIVEYLWLHSAIDEIHDYVACLIDTHDVMHLRHQRLVDSGLHSPFPIDARKEASLLEKFNCVISIQEDERREFMRLRDEYSANYGVINVGVGGFCQSITGSASTAFSKSILFVGGANPLNTAGLQRFIESVWPDIRQKHSDWQLIVCGAVCSSINVGKGSGIRVLGVVENLAPIYEYAAFVINPIWAGTGLKIKSTEALLHAKPLLTTPVGIEGMVGDIRNACVIAFDEREFAERATFLIEHPGVRASFSAAARQYVEHFFAEDAVYGELDAYLGSMVGSRLECGVG